MNLYTTTDENKINYYLNYYKINPLRPHEVDCLKSLLDNLLLIEKNFYVYDGFYFGYKIPQIGNEFDLLKFDTKHLLNIEIKTESNEEKILKQLIKNKYYLKLTGKSLSLFSYVSKTNKFYKLSNDDKLINSSSKDFIDSISLINSDHDIDIDTIFDPSNYLVSPFNSTDKFLNDEYFLTNHQAKAKQEVLKSSLSGSCFFYTITGGPGTGKTLFIYDLAKQYLLSNKKVIIVHCGVLNHGQDKININYENNDLKIIPIKNLKIENINSYDVVIVDESQRIYPYQLKEIIDKSKENNLICIISYDKNQTLSLLEQQNTTINDIDSIPNKKIIKFKNKIRTNKEISRFISLLLNKNRTDKFIDKSKNNIEIVFSRILN